MNAKTIDSTQTTWLELHKMMKEKEKVSKNNWSEKNFFQEMDNQALSKTMTFSHESIVPHCPAFYDSSAVSDIWNSQILSQ